MIPIPIGTTEQAVSAEVLYGDGLPLPEGTTVEVVNDQPTIAAINNGRLEGNTFRAEATFEEAEVIDGKADVASGHVRVTTPNGKESILAYQIAMTGDPELRIVNLKIGDFTDTEAGGATPVRTDASTASTPPQWAKDLAKDKG